LHEAAVRAGRTLSTVQGRIIVPTDVFAECLNLLGKKSSHETALRMAYELLTPSPNSFEVLEATYVIRKAALQKFKQQTASVSYTDCVVMAFADQYQTETIFGFDAAFRKNGYQIIDQEARSAA
jgi:predicted nucleic acid-binding protein